VTWPSIDHGSLSPSGKVSKRAKRAAKAKARILLFPDGFPGPVLPRWSRRLSRMPNRNQERHGRMER
jgi:hypothetical protein